MFFNIDILFLLKIKILNLICMSKIKLVGRRDITRSNIIKNIIIDLYENDITPITTYPIDNNKQR